MSWWVPFPADFLSDPRVKVLSLAARGVLASLIVQARGEPTIPYVNHHTHTGTVAVIALREGAPADPDAAVGAEVVALEAAGLLSWDDAARTLHLHLTAAAPPRPRTAAAPSAPAPTRTKPSDSRAAASLRAARSYFARRQRQWATVPAGVTWEEWAASPEGLAWAERSGVEAATATRCGNAPATPLRNAPATPLQRPPLPHTPSPQKDQKERGKEKLHTPNTHSATPHATPPVVLPQRPATPPPATPLQRPPSVAAAAAPERGVCVSVESTGVDHEHALLALRTRAPKAVSWSYDSATLAAWQRVVRDLDGHIPALTLASYETLGDWLAAGGLGWWSQGRPSLAYLMRPGVLVKLLDDAAEWASAGRPKITHGRQVDGTSARGNGRRLGPAPPATAAEFAADAQLEDPLFALLG